MKRCSFLLAALMVATCLVGVSSTTAQARPYPGTVKTKCHVAYRHVRGHRKPLMVRAWVTSASNFKARGRITLKIVRKRGKKRTFHYAGGAARRNMGKVRRGRHHVRVVFHPKRNSIFRKCSRTGHVVHIR